MADDLRLFAHRRVRLVVLIRLRPERLGVFPARDRLEVEVIGLPTTLVDEIGGEVEMLAVAGDAVELDERELNFLMATINGPKTVPMWST